MTCARPTMLLAAVFLTATSPALSGARPAQAAPVPACAGQLIRDSVGPVCVPLHPQRVVTIEWTYSENLLALGLQPVGMAELSDFAQYVKTPIPVAKGVKDLGQRDRPNLEALAALKPDLIIDASSNHHRAELSRVAPTLVFNPNPPGGQTSYQEMRQTLSVMGRALGREAQARQVLANLDAEIARGRRTLAAAGRAGQTFVLSQGYGKSQPVMRLFGPRALGTQVIGQVGLRGAWQGRTDEYGIQEVSLEGLTTLNTQNFFGITQPDDDVYTAPGNLALWRGLDFVKAGHAYSLDPATWVFGGPYSAQLLVQQVVGVMTRKP